MRSPPWKIWETRILKQFADESDICHKPRYYEGDTMSSACGRAGSGQKAAGSSHQKGTTSNCPSDPWHYDIEDGKKHNPVRAAGLDCSGYEPLYLARAKSLGLWRWLRKRCFQGISWHGNWEPKRGSCFFICSSPSSIIKWESDQQTPYQKGPSVSHRMYTHCSDSSRCSSASHPLWGGTAYPHPTETYPHTYNKIKLTVMMMMMMILTLCSTDHVPRTVLIALFIYGYTTVVVDRPHICVLVNKQTNKQTKTVGCQRERN